LIYYVETETRTRGEKREDKLKERKKREKGSKSEFSTQERECAAFHALLSTIIDETCRSSCQLRTECIDDARNILLCNTFVFLIPTKDPERKHQPRDDPECGWLLPPPPPPLLMQQKNHTAE
jgi:hypothetical protein